MWSLVVLAVLVSTVPALAYDPCGSLASSVRLAKIASFRDQVRQQAKIEGLNGSASRERMAALLIKPSAVMQAQAQVAEDASKARQVACLQAAIKAKLPPGTPPSTKQALKLQLQRAERK